jgi:hypothetical protein
MFVALTAVSSAPATLRAAAMAAASAPAAAAATAAAGPARATTTLTTATTSPAKPIVVDGAIIQPAARCAWTDLLRIAMRDAKLEVESRPPPAIAPFLANRRQLDVEITSAADPYWRLQGIAPQQRIVGAGGGAIIIPGGVRVRIGLPGRAPAPVGPAPAPAPAGGGGANANARGAAGAERASVDFSASVLGRPRSASDVPRVSRVMIVNGSFQLRGRWTNQDEKVYQIDFRSYADKTNVSLQVREMTRGRRAAVLSIEGASLPQLRRERPAEVRTYLEPMLIELCDGRNPLRPQAGDVYRAFQSIPADSGALERVRRIVDSFEALEPAAREAASVQLNQLGRAEVLAAARIDRMELSAEQSLRLDAFIARHATVTDVAAALRDPLFLIDCLEDEDRAVRAAALLQLSHLGGGHEVAFDIDAPPDQRAAAAAALASEFLNVTTP